MVQGGSCGQQWPIARRRLLLCGILWQLSLGPACLCIRITRKLLKTQLLHHSLQTWAQESPLQTCGILISSQVQGLLQQDTSSRWQKELSTQDQCHDTLLASGFHL